jgi:hypothetical protein
VATTKKDSKWANDANLDDERAHSSIELESAQKKSEYHLSEQPGEENERLKQSLEKLRGEFAVLQKQNRELMPSLC